ncbi:hypothetical protein DGM85_23025 (plasmid) [Xanthomonas phaseoli pv. phaseoli]|nr:hypothetical protein DGM93_22965 [Xanthomonas phaseoli pv. phaseoli]QWN31257.1 hypothetical protein DGM85_23025 [Xanthomonas phaseoli pv. phaseoli]QWN35397.1 hypothetical protein DGM81_22725 [Xanthomonas phaseoli pv. phaseoli]
MPAWCAVAVCDAGRILGGHLPVATRSRGRPRMPHGQRGALPVAVGDGCIHPQASGERWSMGGRAYRLQLVPGLSTGAANGRR